MKPNFALTLSFEGIGLLHRAFPGWHMVDEVSLNEPDLADALADLRAKAEGLDSNPIRVKLVIPNDQIRFLHFDSDGLEADEIAPAVHRALNGATPYSVDDLAYDWSIGAGQVYVAAVARETLAEAEAFASEHGFDPLCFVAVPEGRDFVGEPWFGETKAAATHLPEGGRVERDTAAIRIIGTAPLSPATTNPADATEAPAQDPQPEPETPPTPQPETPPEPEIPPAPQPDIPPEPEIPPTPQPDIPPQPEPQPGPDLPPMPDTADVSETPVGTSLPHPEVSLTSQADGDDRQAAPQNPADVKPIAEAEPQEEDDDSKEPDAAAAPAFSSIRARRDDMPSAARRLSGASREPATAPKTPDVSPRDDSPAEPPLTAASPAPPEAADKVTGAPQDALPEEAAARIGATLRPTEADRMSADAGAVDAVDDIPPPPSFMAERTDMPQDDIPPAPIAARPAVEADPSGTPSFSTRRQTGKAGKRRLSLRSAAHPAPDNDLEQEKQRMTIFGARKPASVGGKPRFLGLILTAVLLLFLVGVAAWASIFLEDGIARVLRDGMDPETEQVASTPDAEIVPDQGTEPDAPQAENTVVAALPGATTDIEDQPRTARPEPNPAELTQQQARTRYAVTGIWQRAPDAPGEPSMQTLDEFYLTSIDPKVLEQDAVALPDPDTLRGDARPDTPADPPAADTMFSMDTRGLVQPTPDGALTPEGVRVYAGKPARVPPSRPEETLAEPAEDPAAAAERTAQTERLAGLRPRARPGDLTETNERETLGGRTRSELASLRPKLRPQSAQELAEQAAAASTADVSPDPDAVDAALQAAATVQVPDPFAGATAQAVKVSVKPNARPRNFDRVVQRSQSQAQKQARQTAAVAVPRNQRISPSGPTPTTVARAATEKNALKLRRVNLIGVYGTTSNRRALVRLANGRYKKVKVGDRLDGGRVAAIGTSELRYVKSGRSVTLTMPRG